MAYRRPTRSRSRTSARSSRGSSSRGGFRRSGGRRRTAGSSNRRSGGSRTVRIVIEQPGANPVSRPDAFMMAAAAPKKASF